MPLVLTVRVGQAVQIAEGTFIRVEEKKRTGTERGGMGSSVKLTIFSDLNPIRLVKDGIPPPGVNAAPPLRKPGRILSPKD